MRRFQDILRAVEPGETSKTALERAVTLALSDFAEMLVAHVWEAIGEHAGTDY